MIRSLVVLQIYDQVRWEEILEVETLNMVFDAGYEFKD